MLLIIQGLRSGTTGVVAVVDPDAVHVAWLGDSQVMLLRDGLPLVVMEPHKPERPVSYYESNTKYLIRTRDFGH